MRLNKAALALLPPLLGWRYFKVDYDKGDFLYDVAQSGPLLTFKTKF